MGSSPMSSARIQRPVSGLFFIEILWAKSGSVKNVGVEDTPRISEPLSFFEKTLFSSAPTGVSHR